MSELVPPRDPAAAPNLIDLTEHYNTKLYKAWWTDELPFGVQTFGGVPFDIRGQITVAARHDYQLPDYLAGRRYTGIPVRQKFRVLHFLQGASFRSPDGTETGRYIVHYADGRKVKVPLVYAQTTLDFNAASDPRELSRTPLVWSGRKVKGVLPRLFKLSWENPFPDVEVASLDFETTMAESAPWVIAITAEP